MDLQSFPKIELHVHLDGSVRASTVEVLLPFEKDIEQRLQAPSTCKNLTEYLNCFDLPLRIMQSKEGLKRVAKELAEDLKTDGVLYAEVRFAPMKHTTCLSLEEVISVVLEGFREVKGIQIGLLLCMMRGDTIENNQRVLETAISYIGKGVVGLDLAGDESTYPTHLYSSLCTVAFQNKIPMTIHAGEAAGASSVAEAVSYGASRIGHGVRALESPTLLKEIISKGIVLEICPTSNVQTKVVSTYENHPVKELYEKGVFVTISTDNRTVSHVTLTEEYEKLVSSFSFTEEDLIRINRNAIEGAFLSSTEKDQLKELYQVRLADWKKGSF